MSEPEKAEGRVKQSRPVRKNKLTIRLGTIEMEWVKLKAKELHIPMATYMRMAILGYRRKG